MRAADARRRPLARARALTVALALALAAGCRRSGTPAQAPPRATAPDVGPCARVERDATGDLALGARALRREGAVLRERASRPGARVLGVMGGAHGQPPDRERLARVAAALADADAIAVVGGLAGDAGALGAWLEAALPRDVPALLVPAGSEPLREFRAAFARLAPAHPAWLDGGRVRAYAAPGVELVALPGGGHACEFSRDDAAALASALGPPRGVRVVVTGRAPLQRGEGASDRGVWGVHVGSADVQRAVDALGARGVAALLPYESAGVLAGLDTGRELAAGSDLGEARFALTVGSLSSDPAEDPRGALVGPGAYRIRVDGARVQVDRVDAD